jgi:hypothetical protein
MKRMTAKRMNRLPKNSLRRRHKCQGSACPELRRRNFSRAGRGLLTCYWPAMLNAGCKEKEKDRQPLLRSYKEMWVE